MSETKEKMAQSDYSADSIQVLEGLEAVRKPLSPVSPMYMLGRLRTASNPSST